MGRLQDVIAQTAHASRSAAANNGRVHFTTDGYTISRDDGTAWDPYGPCFPFTTPTDPGTWVNQGSSTIATTKDALVLTGAATGSGANLVCRVQSATAPWTLTVFARGLLFGKSASGGFNGFGVCARSSSGAQIHAFGIFAQASGLLLLRSTKYTSATAFSADYTSNTFSGDLNWLRIADDNTNRICSVSPDGQNWITVHSVTRTDFVTADQCGLFLSTENTTTPNLAPILTVLSYAKT